MRPRTPPPLIYDVEAKQPSPSLMQRTVDTIGDRSALIVQEHNSCHTTLSCEPLQIHYEFKSTHSRLKFHWFTTITRRYANDEKEIVIAEWDVNVFRSETVRLPWSETPKEFVPAKHYLSRRGWHPSLVTDSFEASGKMYTWKQRWTSLDLFLEGSDESVARAFDRQRLFKPRLGFIQIPFDEDILDQIVVTWAIVKHRRAERSAICHLLHTLIFDVLIMTILEVFVWSKHHSN